MRELPEGWIAKSSNEMLFRKGKSGIEEAGLGLWSLCKFDAGWLLMEYDGYVYPAESKAEKHQNAITIPCNYCKHKDYIIVGTGLGIYINDIIDI